MPRGRTVPLGADLALFLMIRQLLCLARPFLLVGLVQIDRVQDLPSGPLPILLKLDAIWGRSLIIFYWRVEKSVLLCLSDAFVESGVFYTSYYVHQLSLIVSSIKKKKFPFAGCGFHLWHMLLWIFVFAATWGSKYVKCKKVTLLSFEKMLFENNMVAFLG